ncbi:RDD family protein [Niveibacterium sp. 24ML]|uniref:RDD family protein n=1 Tax=Niveibacterium sp. 24ML TaxID=2985512 RepID=UPI00226E6FED|nr:RDD family protein [Niveibacterium sp. 24ML]MCX9157620.1 RDD family protein [Niveibacterium sp. 24ML]
MNTTRPTAELAGLRRRMACMLYESLLLVGVLAFAFLVPQLIYAIASKHVLPGWASWLHVTAVLGIYFYVLWRRNGQTLAMQTWRLQLVDANSGMPPSAAQCIIRYLLAWPSVLFAGAGLVWALVDRDRQFMHDRFAGTCIVLLPGRPGEQNQS